LIERHGCGIAVEPGNARALADAILRFADQAPLRTAMGARARVASELFARDRQVAAHADVLEDVARR
jgi:glycosyltransferase involved in cell wall biosynthesis